MPPGSLARIIRLVTRARRLQTTVGRLHAAVVRGSRGRIRRSRLLGGGQPVLSLSTIGRRTGEERSTVIAHLPVGGSWAVFAMNLGSPRDPAWALNLAAHPQARIHVDGRDVAVTARRAEGSEAAALWERYARRLPAAEGFRTIAGRTIPVFVLEPAHAPGKLGSAMPIEVPIDADDPLSPYAEPSHAPVRSRCPRARAGRRRAA
jgi:deazaflavin-dependent oxidoreductase (nitroreductase family)